MAQIADKSILQTIGNTPSVDFIRRLINIIVVLDSYA
jgi:hypothetical protein